MFVANMAIYNASDAAYYRLHSNSNVGEPDLCFRTSSITGK
jgi:hypothetical protein